MALSSTRRDYFYLYDVFPNPLQLDPAELKLPGAGNRSSWCSDDPPLSYSYVQSSYWDVGWLRYWQAEKWPLLAFAMIFPLIGN